MSGTGDEGIRAAWLLTEKYGAIVVETDTSGIDGHYEDDSSDVPGNPLPVHQYLLVQRCIHVIEYACLNQLAADKVYEFCFICLPSKIRGATGVFVRPVAVI